MSIRISFLWKCLLSGVGQMKIPTGFSRLPKLRVSEKSRRSRILTSNIKPRVQQRLNPSHSITLSVISGQISDLTAHVHSLSLNLGNLTVSEFFYFFFSFSCPFLISTSFQDLPFYYQVQP